MKGTYIITDNMSETVLDNLIGTGSQVIKKIEQAPLFKPEARYAMGIWYA